VPSTKEYTPWPKRNDFIYILQYKKLVLESRKEMADLFMVSREEFIGTMLAVAAAKED
jgi:hypothetical protein